MAAGPELKENNQVDSTKMAINRFSQALAQKGVWSRFSKQAWAETCAVFLGSKLNILLLATPFAIIAHAVQWPDAYTFIFAMMALCPLAERLGYVTEQLAMFTNDTLGGLLNATFGNATEVIIACFALQSARQNELAGKAAEAASYLRVVQLTLLGSVISNLLLVLGSAFFAGGTRFLTQRFNSQAVTVNCTMLALSCLAVALPTFMGAAAQPGAGEGALRISRLEAVLLLAAYALYLVFQLGTHRHLFEGPDDKEDDGDAAHKKEQNGTLFMAPGKDMTRPVNGVDPELELVPGTAPGAGNSALGVSVSSSTHSFNLDVEAGESEKLSLVGGTTQSRRRSSGGGGGGAAHSDAGACGDDDDEDELELTMTGALIWLSLITVAISVLSDMIMDAIKGASSELHVPMPFLTAIMVPLVGNAAEHASAILLAYKNRIEISLGVAVGSSTQVGVAVVPLCVCVAWGLGCPLTLDLQPFEAAVLCGSVLLAVIVLQDGVGNWLKGSLLIMSYVFIAAAFWWHHDPALVESTLK